MPSRPRTRPVKEVPSKPTRTAGRPSGKAPGKRKVEQLTAQRALWSDEQVETAVGWLATIDESQAGDIAMRLQELASNPTLARLHGPTILASVARLGAPITGLVERLPLELSCGERAMFLSAGGSDWQSRGRIVAAAGAPIVASVREALDRSETSETSRRACCYAAILLGPVAGSLVPALEPLVEPPDFESRSSCGFDGSVTVPLLASLALVSIDPRRAEHSFEYLRIAIRCSTLVLGGMRSATSPQHDLSQLLGGLPEHIRVSLADDIVDVMTTGNEHAELLGALGTPGITRALRLLEDVSYPNYGLDLALLGHALAGVALDPDERSRAANISKRRMLAANNDATYLAFTCLFGGVDACGPELAAGEVVEALCASLSSQPAELWPFLFDLLHRRGVEIERLRAGARSIITHRGTPWLAAFAHGGAPVFPC